MARLARCAEVARLLGVADCLATSTHFDLGDMLRSGNGSMLISGSGSMLISGIGSIKN